MIFCSDSKNISITCRVLPPKKFLWFIELETNSLCSNMTSMLRQSFPGDITELLLLCLVTFSPKTLDQSSTCDAVLANNLLLFKDFNLLFSIFTSLFLLERSQRHPIWLGEWREKRRCKKGLKSLLSELNFAPLACKR